MFRSPPQIQRIEAFDNNTSSSPHSGGSTIPARRNSTEKQKRFKSSKSSSKQLSYSISSSGDDDNNNGKGLPLLLLDGEETIVGNNSDNSPKPAMFLFGRDLSHYNPNVQFTLATVGVFVFNVLYSYLQELLAVHVANRKFALFLAVCQFAGYAFWAHILARINRSSMSKSKLISNGTTSTTRQQYGRRNSASSRNKAVAHNTKFVALSLLRAFDLAVTNMAMMYLNYPAKTLIKSCRVVFTMLLGVLIRGKRYKAKDYFAVMTLVSGLAIFLHADSATSAVFHPLGVVLLVLSLLCDGTVNNWSEQMMEQYSLTQDEFHAKLYFISLLATVVAAHAHGELIGGIEYFLMQRGTVDEIDTGTVNASSFWTVEAKAAALILFGTTGIMGASCLGAITKRFGALSMALTSTARKATTLFLSFALFQNDCSSEHVFGVSLFLSGLVFKTLNRSSTSSSSSQQQTAGEVPQESVQRKSSWMQELFRTVPTWMTARSKSRNANEDREEELKPMVRVISVDMEFGMPTD